MTTETTRGGRTALVALGGALAGALLVALVLLDPFGLGIGSGAPRAAESGPMDHGAHGGAAESPPAAGDREVLFYRNPMNPAVTSPVPAKDEMGMDYAPVYADQVDEAQGQGTTVRIDAAVVQNMNVRTALVEKRDLYAPIRTVGSLDYDQQRMVTVTTKYSGWVEKVHVNYVGEPVTKGQPLFEVYSPELVQTIHELFSALDFARDMGSAPEDARRRTESLVDAARTRLGYWDIAREQIERLEETREVFRTLTVVAPASGLVMKRLEGLEGMAIRPGMEIFHIADISRLWLLVEIFEDQVAWVREGTPAKITLPYFPGETFRGKVRFLEPEFSEATRTMRVKIEIDNPRGELRKGMFATVVFEPLAVAAAVAVPSQAILRTGERNLVVVAAGEGRFTPREVVAGHEAEGWTEILDGLEVGEVVVTSSQFLLDSESKLREAIQKMIVQKSAAPAGHVH
jgi:RND family efflux transporter MFP subunit